MTTSETPEHIARAGLRRNAGIIATGIAGVSTLALLAAGSLVPLMVGGFTVTAVAGWLGGLGGNALASWLDNWSRSATARAIGDDPTGEKRLIEQLARDLQDHLGSDSELAANTAILIQYTEAIPTALDALRGQGERQAHLLQALLEDVQDSRFRNERLHDVTLRAVFDQGEMLRTIFTQGQTQLVEAIDTLLVEVRQIQAVRIDMAAVRGETATIKPRVSAMRGLNQALFSALSQCLMQCDEFQTNSRLRAVFAVEELYLWQLGLPEADNLRSRVDLTIDYLRNKRRNDNEHALITLLDVLLSRYDPADSRYGAIQSLSSRLRETLQSVVQINQTEPSVAKNLQPSEMSAFRYSRRQLVNQHESLQRELELRQNKANRIREALAIEVGVAKIFQLEQELRAEELELVKIEGRLKEIETELQGDK